MAVLQKEMDVSILQLIMEVGIADLYLSTVRQLVTSDIHNVTTLTLTGVYFWATHLLHIVHSGIGNRERAAMQQHCNRDDHSQYTCSDSRKCMLQCTDRGDTNVFVNGFCGAMQPRWLAVEAARRSSGVHTAHTHVAGTCECHSFEDPDLYVRSARCIRRATVVNTLLWLFRCLVRSIYGSKWKHVTSSVCTRGPQEATCNSTMFSSEFFDE